MILVEGNVLVGVSNLKFLSLKSIINSISNKRNPKINKLNSVFIGSNTEQRNNHKNHKIETKSPENNCFLFHKQKKKDYLKESC